METLILGWYVLTETGSVVWLAAFGALQYVGTLISPMFGVAGDRIGQKRLLLLMRASYTAVAAAMAVLALTGTLSVAAVLALSTVSGLIRPSDMGMRNALIGATMPAPLLAGALGIERTSADTARIIGALSGAGLVAWLGIEKAYLVVVVLYLLSFLLMRGAAETGGSPRRSAPLLRSVWEDLAAGFAHVRATPPLLAAMCLAFLANFAAYPLTGGLLPHVARDVYGLDQTGLGTLVASFAAGGLLGSLVLVVRGAAFPPGRTIIVSALIWFSLLLVFAGVRSAGLGMAMLFVIGVVQSFCMVPMTVLLLRVSREGFRGRVMGLRILAVYGLALGLLSTGPIVELVGYSATVLAFAGAGLACTLAILLRWRRHLWPLAAPANAGHPT
jgi:MFS family permease